MLRNLSERIVSFYIDQNLLQGARRDWYVYTVEKALFTLLAWGPMLWVGLQTGGPWHTAVFLLGLTTLRKTAGGYHAHAWWQCLLASSALLAACNTPYFVPESTPLSTQLINFQKQKFILMELMLRKKSSNCTTKKKVSSSKEEPKM